MRTMIAHGCRPATAERGNGRLTLSDFSSIARIYRQTATAQKSAAERLFWMLGVERTDDVLDLGCGTGHLAQEIRVLTDGRVVGIDPLARDDRARARGGAGGHRVHHRLRRGARHARPVRRHPVQLGVPVVQGRAEGAGQLLRGVAPGRPDGDAGAGPPRLLPDLRARGGARSPPIRGRARPGRASARPGRSTRPRTSTDGLFTDAGFALVAAEIEELREHATPERAVDMFDREPRRGI